jgi:hypothetical protein
VGNTYLFGHNQTLMQFNFLSARDEGVSLSLSSILARPPLIATEVELLPASEKGLNLTAVSNTLDVDGAPKVVKSVTTFRGGELVGIGGISGENEDKREPNTVLLSGDRGGIEGE